MASKRVGCSPFLPNTESDSYIESQKAKNKERESERENKLQRERERERARERASEIYRETEQNRVSKTECHHCHRKRERKGGPE